MICVWRSVASLALAGIVITGCTRSGAPGVGAIVSSNQAGADTSYPATGAKFQIANAKDAWVWDTSAIERTTDGGRTWVVTLTLKTTTRSLWALEFVNPTDGWAVFRGGSYPQTKYSLFATTDGGVQWTSLLEPQPRVLDIDFVTPHIGFALSPGGTFLKSTNGGVRWTQSNSSHRRVKFQSVCFSTPRIGWGAIGDDVYSTTDGGSTWRVVRVLPNTDLRTGKDSLSCADHTVWLVFSWAAASMQGPYYLIYRSGNGGRSWQAVVDQRPNRGHSPLAVNKVAGLVVDGSRDATIFSAPPQAVSRQTVTAFTTTNGGKSFHSSVIVTKLFENVNAEFASAGPITWALVRTATVPGTPNVAAVKSEVSYISLNRGRSWEPPVDAKSVTEAI